MKVSQSRTAIPALDSASRAALARMCDPEAGCRFAF